MALEKIDSNFTGLRIAREETIGKLPAVIAAIAASGVLTMAANPVAATTITVGAVTYTFRNPLSSGPTVPNEILIGATAANTRANVVAAVTAGAGSGVSYSVGTVAHPTVTAAVGSGNLINFTALTAGTAGNAIATTSTATATFGAATLTGGAAQVGTGPIWKPLEPNTYPDFGGEISTVRRNPINDSRQNRKGSATGVTASGGFNQDVTTSNLTDIMQGFFFAKAREKTGNYSLAEDTLLVVDEVTATTIEVPGLAAIPVNRIVLASGFAETANNNIHLVTASAADTITIGAGLTVEATPPATAQVRAVGHQFAAGDISVALNGQKVRFTSAAVDMTTLGVIAGEWLFVGGDNAANRLSDASRGFARIGVVTEDYLELDKVDWEPVVEAGTGKSVQIFFGTLIKNELKSLIHRTTYQLERTLDEDEDGEMAEYLIGSVPNEMTINFPSEDKVNVDMSFMSLDSLQRDGTEGLKPGVRPEILEEDCFNTSIDFARIRLSVIDETNSNVTPLAAFLQDMTITIQNNATVNKALGRFGGFDITVGNFTVGGSVNAYFNGIQATRAVRQNTSCTLDTAIVKDNVGLLFDIPLLTLGNGKLQVEADTPIMLPLTNEAARSKFGNTMTYQQFYYLPDIANDAV